MRKTTLQNLRCPDCADGALSCSESAQEINTGSVDCGKCGKSFPILAGVLVLVSDVRSYLLEHVKGISRYVSDSEIPKKFRGEFLEAKSEIAEEHIEEDLEAERVTSLYVMNHYLRAKDMQSSDPLIKDLIGKYWDNGPFTRIRTGLAKKKGRLVELGCGVGGLCPALADNLTGYLGLDSSFASIALARHFVLGAPLKVKQQRVPHDLLQGAVSREVKIGAANPTFEADFIVCDLADPPIREANWDFTAALNVIDMLPNPADLPKLQNTLLKKGGIAIQSCPYIWHPEVSKKLRKNLPKDVQDSARAAELLYERVGFSIEKTETHVPWLFFKNVRQLEIYSVHLFFAEKK